MMNNCPGCWIREKLVPIERVLSKYPYCTLREKKLLDKSFENLIEVIQLFDEPTSITRELNTNHAIHNKRENKGDKENVRPVLREGN